MAIVIHFAALFDEGQSTQGHVRKMLHRGLDICLDSQLDVVFLLLQEFAL